MFAPFFKFLRLMLDLRKLSQETDDFDDVYDADKINVVIVDASPLFRESLARLIHEDEMFGNIAETGDKHLGLFYIERLNPQVVIVDMHMKKDAATEITRYVKGFSRPPRVIMMTDRDDSEELMSSVHLQAEGYISKLIEVVELKSQIRRVASGQIVVSNRLMAALTRAFRDDTAEVGRNISRLTNRERDILKCLAAGMKNQEIAQYHNITLGTVKVHVKHLLKKMAFTSRTQAALWAQEHGVKF